MDLIFNVLVDGVIGSLKNVITIALIVIPLMIGLEVAKDINLLDRINGWMYPAAKLFKISKEATFPLLVGLIFGISYGAGVILQYAREGRLTKRELVIVNTFLAISHALVEDTLLFVVVGASGTMLIISRMVLAIIVTIIVAHFIPEDKDAEPLLYKGIAAKNMNN
ncbi:hypothetical protein GGQ84_002447 [Desulfitispora alkaliphila]|uniref:nucleoside recognition domain-containing protein n=1 Tax=Desulfitispora alkaliphila TaxID=622674 RepID=UPI003D1C141A